MVYIFYDPRNNNCIMGQSTEKTTMEFPYIVEKKSHNVLQHLKVVKTNEGSHVKIIVGRWNDPNNQLIK